MRAKSFLLALAVAAGCVTLALAVASLPPVQTWAARRAAASIAGPGATIERASFGANHLSLQGVRVEMDGAVLSLPSIDADVSLIPALLWKRYQLTSLTARGWTLDLTRARSTSPNAAERGYPWLEGVFGGALALFNVKADVALDGAHLEGDVIFPDELGRPAAKAHVDIAGGGVGVGRDARFLCNGRAEVMDERSPVSSIASSAVLSARMDASGKFSRAELRADATASGRQFPNGISLSGAASAARNGGKESLSVSLVRGSERIVSFEAAAPDSAIGMAGTWELNLRDTDLAPFSLGRALPEFYVAGGGSYDFDPSTGDVHAAGKLNATADRLGVVDAGLGALGHVNLVADFDMARLGASLRVARLDTSLSGAAPVASVRALQSFEFNTSTGVLKVPNPNDDLVGILIRGIPLSWLKGVLPRVGLIGGDAQGELVMRAEDGRLVLRTKAPLRTSGTSVSVGGTTEAAGLELTAFVLGDYAPQGWQFQLAPFSVRSEGIKMLSLEARIGRLAGAGRAMKAAGSWSASVPMLLALPAAAALPKLSEGDASGSFEASLDSTKEIRVKLALQGLASASLPGITLPSVNSDIRADFGPHGRTTFGIPVHMDYGARVADLALAGTVSSDAKGTLLDAELSGTRFLADDLAAFAVLLGGSAPAAPADAAGAETAPAARPPAPLWPRARARLVVRFEDIACPRIELQNIRGTLHIEGDTLTVEGGSATVGDGSSAKVDGQLAFSPRAERPYALKARVSIGNLDSAPLFRAINPDRPPEVEGRFNVTSNVTGTGAGMRDLLADAQGDLRLTSKDGRFRALRTDVVDSIKQAPSKLVDALDTVSALFGKKSENLGTALVDSAKELSDIHYDQMSLAAERGPDMDIRLTEITLLAPEERLAGTGRISFVQGTPVRDQPLSIDLEMGVRGQLGKFLDVVGMLKDGQDTLGYSPLYQPIHLGGTLRNVDQSQWRDMLVQAPLRKGGGLFDKLLGK
jgi:hypothetical protein